MSTRKRRERDKEAMRRRILEAAKQLFVKEGFDNVTMRRIADRIEYSPAAIYRYFASKREILSVLREEGFARFVARQQKGKELCPDPLERLRLGGREYIRFALSEPEYHHLMFGTGCREVDLEGKWAVSAMAAFNNLKDTVVECVASGHFGDVDVDVVVFGMWSSVQGLAHLLSTGQVDVLKGDQDIDVLLEKILAFFRRPGK